MSAAADAATHVARLRALLSDPALRVPATSLEHIQNIGKRRQRAIYIQVIQPSRGDVFQPTLHACFSGYRYSGYRYSGSMLLAHTCILYIQAAAAGKQVPLTTACLSATLFLDSQRDPPLPGTHLQRPSSCLLCLRLPACLLTACLPECTASTACLPGTCPPACSLPAMPTSHRHTTSGTRS